MFQLTIKEALNALDKTLDDGKFQHYVYRYFEGDVTFYVGRSLTPFARLRQHIGEEGRMLWPDAIGQLVLDNQPASLEWLMEVYTLQEIDPDAYKIAQENEISGYAYFANSIEEQFIRQLHPCMNERGNQSATPLPHQYIKRPIANEGVKITEEE